MRTIPALVVAAAVGLGACAQRSMEMDTGDVAPIAWRATIETIGNADSLVAPTNITGTATMPPASNATMTNVMVELHNGEPNATYPWHVHAGSCGSGGGIVGPPAAYTPLTIDATGGAQATVTLPFSTPTVGDFSVNVHKSADELGVIIACGMLAPGATPVR
jgi:hypothetical protein